MLLRVAVGITCVTVLLVVFIYQRFDWCAWFGLEARGIARFMINRAMRFIINDLAAIGVIFALFYRASFVKLAILIQVIGILLFLLPYFALKLYFPDYNGPLINFLHRIILNPMLMMLLIPALYYQRMKEQHVTPES
jgi:exosortase F-associated protein